MMLKTGIDLELGALLRDELHTLYGYIKMFNGMAVAEKNGLREWMALGHSASSNPFSIYGDNGLLMDFVSAFRFNEDMVANYGLYLQDDDRCSGCVPVYDPDFPF